MDTGKVIKPLIIGLVFVYGLYVLFLGYAIFSSVDKETRRLIINIFSGIVFGVATLSLIHLFLHRRVLKEVVWGIVGAGLGVAYFIILAMA